MKLAEECTVRFRNFVCNQGGLGNMLHTSGVNVRFLGCVRDHILTLPLQDPSDPRGVLVDTVRSFLSQLCLEEMVLRALKCLFRRLSRSVCAHDRDLRSISAACESSSSHSPLHAISSSSSSATITSSSASQYLQVGAKRADAEPITTSASATVPPANSGGLSLLTSARLRCRRAAMHILYCTFLPQQPQTFDRVLRLQTAPSDALWQRQLPEELRRKFSVRIPDDELAACRIAVTTLTFSPARRLPAATYFAQRLFDVLGISVRGAAPLAPPSSLRGPDGSAADLREAKTDVSTEQRVGGGEFNTLARSSNVFAEPNVVDVHSQRQPFDVQGAITFLQQCFNIQQLSLESPSLGTTSARPHPPPLRRSASASFSARSNSSLCNAVVDKFAEQLVLHPRIKPLQLTKFARLHETEQRILADLDACDHVHDHDGRHPMLVPLLLSLLKVYAYSHAVPVRAVESCARGEAVVERLLSLVRSPSQRSGTAVNVHVAADPMATPSARVLAATDRKLASQVNVSNSNVALSSPNSVPITPSLATRLEAMAVYEAGARFYESYSRFYRAHELYSQALSVAELTSSQENHSYGAQILFRMGNVMQQQGCYDAARIHFERSLEMLELHPCLQRLAAVATLNALGMTHTAQSHLREAESLHRRALALLEPEVHACDHDAATAPAINLPSTSTTAGSNRISKEKRIVGAAGMTANAATTTYTAHGTYTCGAEGGNCNRSSVSCSPQAAAAASCLDRDDDRVRESGSVFSNALAVTLQHLGLAYELEGQFTRAEPLYERALAIRENWAAGCVRIRGGREADDVGDCADRGVAAALECVAALRKAQGRFREAEPLFRRALAMKEHLFGLHHPALASTLICLANLAQAMRNGASDSAHTLFQRVVSLYAKALNSSCPDVPAILDNLTALHQVPHAFAAQAEPLYKRVLDITGQTLGAQHPQVAASLNNLALLYCHQARFAEAQPLYERSSQISQKTLGADHPNVAAALSNLAGVYTDLGKFEMAEPLYWRVLHSCEKVLGHNHPRVADVCNNLASLFVTTRRFGEAEKLYQRDLAITELAFGSQHPNVMETTRSLIPVLRSLGRKEEAFKLQQRLGALSLAER